jgi:hypothetical protein
MSWHKSKQYPADIAFSRLIRLRDGRCTWCGGFGSGPEGIFGLQAAHLFSRGKWNTRYDPINVSALCISCHRKAHKNEKDYEAYVISLIGQSEFDRLTLRAWARSPLGSNFWKKLSYKKAMEILTPLFE